LSLWPKIYPDSWFCASPKFGPVYPATDLKPLPAEMAASPERLERFQREAKALAALDHARYLRGMNLLESGLRG